MFAGSDVSMFDLSKAYAMGNTAEAHSLVKLVATNEFMRAMCIRDRSTRTMNFISNE